MTNHIRIRKHNTDRQQRLAKLRKDWLDGGWNSQHELAVRYGVSDCQICRDLKIIREVCRAEFEEESKTDFDRRIKQLESVAGRAAQGYERSRKDHEEVTVRYEKKPCTECANDKDKKSTCRKCEGRGFTYEEHITKRVVGQAGDPRFLSIITKCITEICRLRGHYPDKRQGLGSKLQYKDEPVLTSFANADPELIVRHRLLLFEIEQSKNGHRSPDVLEAEFEREEQGDSKENESQGSGVNKKQTE